MINKIKSILPLNSRRKLGRFIDRSFVFLPRFARVRLKFYKSHGYFPNVKNPRSFSEKVVALKISGIDISRFADKVQAKRFVQKRVGAQHVIPSFYEGDSLPPKSERTWAMPYVVKVNNGSGGNIFVKNEADTQNIDEKISAFLAYDFSAASDELFYRKIMPQVIVEKYIGGVNALPLDYKFFVFDGKMHMVQVDTDRATAHKRAFFDRTWARIPLWNGKTVETRHIEKPTNFDEMIALAERIGNGFGFVRVDLYNIDGQIFFGELSFTPDSGLSRFDPVEKNEELGRLWPWPDTGLARMVEDRSF